MIEFNLEAPQSDLDRTLAALANDRWLDSRYRKIVDRLTEEQKRHYRDVAQRTPYSPIYRGKLKPSGNVIAGGAGDLGYGIDTQSLFNDLTRPIVQDKAIVIESNLIYADAQESLLNRNHGESFFADDQDIFELAAAVIGDAFDRL